jgi:hypothetical protein
MTSETYFRVGGIIGSIVGFITFIGSWWYCAANYGFLLGFGLGWLPAAIAASIAGALTALLWGPVLLLVAAGLLWLASENAKEPSRPPEAASVSDPYASFSDRCVERRNASGVVTEYICGDVIVPGPPVHVPMPTVEAAPPGLAPETGSQPSTARAAEPEPVEGQTATNRLTGERVVLRNGEWTSATPVPPCTDGTASCEPWERDWPVEEQVRPSPN